MSQHHHLYGSRWQRISKQYLRLHPFCVYHQERGQAVFAELVDHIIPHKGDLQLFWDQSNWQPLCKLCHDSDKQHLEKTGHRRGCDLEGNPIDPTHHWNQGERTLHSASVMLNEKNQ